MDQKIKEVMNEIILACTGCPRLLSCPEEDCILYRIEKIVLSEEEHLNGKDSN